MKHFSEARSAARADIAALPLSARLERAALIWDLRGRLRLLVKPQEGQDPAALQTDLQTAMVAAAGGFWSGECWIWHDHLDQATREVYEQAWREATVVSLGPPEIKEVDRHLSKGTWFGLPISAPWPLNEHTPPIIAFFSFKGGVGRTTAVASFAIQLARAGKRVSVVDLDLEAPGVAALLAPDAGTAHYGVLDYLLDRPANTGPDFNLGPYYADYDDQVAVENGPPISVIPAGALDESYLEKLARVDYERLLDPGPGNESLLASLIRAIRADRNPDYVLIDSRAGLHDIGGLALNGMAHLDVLFSLDNEQSWAGLRLVLDHLGRRRIERGNHQQDCSLVYAMAPASSAPDRGERVAQFTDKAFEFFSRSFYDEEPQGGWPMPPPPDAWPVPQVDAPDEPHFPFALGFSTEIQQARRIRDMVPLLTQGDYRAFRDWLLSRVGRSLP